MVGASKPGSRVMLQLFRRGATREVAVQVAEFEPERTTRRARADTPAAPPAAKTALGLGVSDLTDAQKRELRLKGGVKVDAVDGAASKAGVLEGDIIVSIDNVEVTDAKQFAAISGKVDKAKPVSVLVRRGDAVNFVIIRPPR